MQLSGLPIDSRTDWDKVNRRQCWRGAKNLGIDFPAGATHEQMVNLFIQHNIQPSQVVDFVPVHVRTEDGGSKIVMEPEVKERTYDEAAELRRQEEFEKRIEAAKEEAEREAERKNSSQIDDLRAQNKELKAMLLELRDMVQKGNTPPTTFPEEPEAVTDYDAMKMPQLKKLAKERGLTIPVTTKKAEIIDKLRGLDNG